MDDTLLVGALERHREEIAREAVTQVRAAVPALATATTADALRTTILAGIDQFVTAWREGREFGASELGALLQARPPLRHPVSREDLLHSVRVITEVVREHDGLRLTAVGDDPALALGVLRQRETGRRLTQQLLEEIDRRLRRVEQRTLRDRCRTDGSILDLLLAPSPVLRVAAQLAMEQGLDLTGTWCVAVLEPDHDPDTAAAELRRRIDRTRAAALVSVRGGRVVLASSQDPSSWLRPEATAGVGRHLALTTLRTSMDEACAALEVSRMRGMPVSIEDAWLDVVLTGGVTPTDLSDRLLEPLFDPDPERRTWLLETLEAYLDAGGGITAAARRLHLHRESFRYRLQQLERLLGDALEDPDQRLLLHLAVRARRLSACASGAADASVTPAPDVSVASA